MSHPHAESGETLDCLTKPQDRETIDYQSSLLSALRHTISVHLNQTTPVHNLPSSQALHSVSAITCIPECTWSRWPCIPPPSHPQPPPPPPHAVCTSPLVRVLTRAPMRWHAPLFDSHLMTFWSYPQQTRALIKEELIHTLRGSNVDVRVLVCVRSAMNLNQGSPNWRAIPTPVSSLRTCGNKESGYFPWAPMRQLVLCLVKG